MNRDDFSVADYFGKESEYAIKDKQDFVDSMQNANKFLTNGLMNYKKKNNMDLLNEIDEYRQIAVKAYEGRRYAEARVYYNKILEALPHDYEATFYVGLCKALSSEVTESSIEETYSAYKKAIAIIPVEYDWDEIIYTFGVQFADLIIAWFKKSQDNFHKFSGDWNKYNMKHFYSHADLAKKAVDYMDNIMPLILESDMPDSRKAFPYGFWYCRMCSDFCCQTLYFKVTNQEWSSNSRRPVGPLGYPLSKKAVYIQKYDDMCFEIRKYKNDFERMESEWDYGFDRTNPPTSYEGQQKDNDINRLLQIKKEKEIDQRLLQWRTLGGQEKEIRNKKIRKYMSSHPSERIKYQELKKEILDITLEVDNARQRLENANRQVTSCIAYLDSQKLEVSSKKMEIGKLERKIFGKVKAQEQIQILHNEICEAERRIVNVDLGIQTARNTVKDCELELSEINTRLQLAQRECDMYVNNCII